MKIKSLLIGALAFGCFALAGCSDDVIDSGTQNGKEEGTSAYLTISFAPNSSSSRSTADDANNQGDKDGTAEDSGHMNTGTDAENAINSVLVVVKGTKGEGNADNPRGYAKLYSKFDAITDKTEATEIVKNGDSFSTNYDIEINTGTYDVLVVANPYSSLTKDIQGLANGTYDATAVNTLYNNILDGKYTADKTTVDNFAGDIVQVEIGENNTKSLKGIMMSNKTPSSVTVTAANLEGNAVEAIVDVERVASKITYRHYGYDETTKKAVEITSANQESVKQDVYPVSVILPSQVVPITYEVTYQKIPAGDGQPEQVKETLNKAVTSKGEVIYVFKMGGETKYYSEDEVTISDGNATLANGAEAEDVTEDMKYSIQYKSVSNAPENNPTWFVKIEAYALVNLSKSVYNVRHTTANAGEGKHFGTLNGSNYLYTPNWETSSNGGINNVEFDENDKFPEGFSTDSWFFNTLTSVSEASKPDATTNGNYFNSLDWASMSGTNDNGEDSDDNTQSVTGNKHHNSNDLSPIGNLLAYCLENSTDIEHQTHGLSTGIAFRAKIYEDANCTKGIQTLYRYAGHLFTDVAHIKEAYKDVASDSEYAKLADLTNDSDAEALAAAGVVKYDGNTCYYYSTEIKHFDNDIPLELGNMEFAIMRNNIYSLAVTGINIIGDPWVDPTPSTPNEILSTYLTVQAEIMPWIVRYHDIEFN